MLLCYLCLITQGSDFEQAHAFRLAASSDFNYFCGLRPKQKAMLSQYILTETLSFSGNDRIVKGSNLLHSLASRRDQCGSRTSLAVLFAKCGVDPNQVNSLGYTPLMFALDTRDFDLAKVLLACGADVNIGISRNVHHGSGKTALHLAVGRNVEITNLIIGLGAKLDIQDNEGNTALMLAVMRRHIEVASVLIDNGADGSIQNKEGDSPISFIETFHVGLPSQASDGTRAKRVKSQWQILQRLMLDKKNGKL